MDTHMKIFTCNDFDGFYPVGTAAVIIAETEDKAREMMTEALKQRQLGGTNPQFTLKRLAGNKPNVLILCDGNY